MAQRARFDAPMLALSLAVICLRAGAAPLTVVVDSSGHPELAGRSEAIRAICEKWYPRIDELLYGVGHRPAHSEIRVIYSLQQTAASAAFDTVRLHPSWAAKADDREWEGLLAHELTHLVENYGGLQYLRCDGLRRVYCFFRVRMDFAGDRYHWISEGIADYVRYYRVHGDLQPRLERADEKLRKRGYKQGYRVAASFLLWLEQRKDRDIVRKLNGAIHAHRYSPGLFRQFCGAKLDDLWAEFYATASDASAAR